MKSKSFLLTLVILFVASISIMYAFLFLMQFQKQTLKTLSVSVTPVSSTIAAEGTVHSENEAELHFQTAGKLVYLPFKEGDSVYQGQTIASIDQRLLQRNIQNAVDAYQNQKIGYDITNDFNGDRALSDTGLSIAARRQLETAVNTLDQAQLAVEIQQISAEQSVLTSPIDGIITHEDVTLAGQNITPVTSFSVADEKSLIFRANVLASDIDFVSIGVPVSIELNGMQIKLKGTVEKIYPEKKTLLNGQDVFPVDIQSDDLQNTGRLDQSGTVLIQSNTDAKVILVPRWTLLSQSKIWVYENNKLSLKTVITGKTHGDYIEVLKGLSNQDRIILNPESLVNKEYLLL